MPLTPDQALAKAQKLYDELCNRRPALAQADDYYRGKQPLRYASDKWREFHAARYEKFSDNWCAPVANSPQERLRVDGFSLDDNPDQSDAEKKLWRDWQINNMETQSSQGFLSTLIGARSFVLVWGTPDDEPLATWERPDQAIVGYDAERPGQRVAALKTWCDGDDEYATLYTADEVWKFERQVLKQQTLPYGTGNTYGSGQYQNPKAATFFANTAGLIIPGVSGQTSWRLRDVSPNPMPNPLGEVPMVEMPNRPMLGNAPLSEISGTIAMQDAINLLWAYLFTAADFASMPARVVMGQDPPMIPVLDNTGQQVGEKPVDMRKIAEDRILWLTGQNAKIGQWEAAKLDVFTNVIESGVAHIAAQTRTPPHYLILGKGMVNVSADGMRAAETGLVQKVNEEQLFLTPPVRDVFRLMALVRGDAKVADQCRTGTVKWKDAENRSEAMLVDALQKLGALGFPFRFLAERYGLGPTEIERLMKLREAEKSEDPLAQAVDLLGKQTGKPGQPPQKPAQTGAGAG